MIRYLEVRGVGGGGLVRRGDWKVRLGCSSGIYVGGMLGRFGFW